MQIEEHCFTTAFATSSLFNAFNAESTHVDSSSYH